MSYLDVKTRRADDTLVVYIGGYLNSLLGEEVERVVTEALAAGRRRVLLHFGDTRLINSIGISIIIGIVEKVREHNGTLAFCSLSKIHRELFEMTGVSRFFQAFASEEDALGYLGRQG